MENIENYESVELGDQSAAKHGKFSFKRGGERKKFKLNFVLKKRHVVLTALVFALSAAVYINYLYSTGELGLVAAEKEAETKNYGDSLLVSGEGGEVEGTDAAAYFSEARLTRQQSRDEAVETLQNLYNSAEVTDDQLVTLSAQATAIAKNIETEAKIENIIKAKGFEDCIVYITDESADVIVQTEGLLSTEAAQIKEAIIQETSVPVENISIIEVN